MKLAIYTVCLIGTLFILNGECSAKPVNLEMSGGSTPYKYTPPKKKKAWNNEKFGGAVFTGTVAATVSSGNPVGGAVGGAVTYGAKYVYDNRNYYGYRYGKMIVDEHPMNPGS